MKSQFYSNFEELIKEYGKKQFLLCFSVCLIWTSHFCHKAVFSPNASRAFCWKYCCFSFLCWFNNTICASNTVLMRYSYKTTDTRLYLKRIQDKIEKIYEKQKFFAYYNMELKKKAKQPDRTPILFSVHNAMHVMLVSPCFDEEYGTPLQFFFR